MSLDEAVAAAVAELLPIAANEPAGAPLAERVHALLWPYVVSAVAASSSAPDANPSATRDRRVRAWQYTVRFWDSALELVAESDPAIVQGTGALPEIVERCALEMHGDATPFELSAESIRSHHLTQLRNNLGRYNTAALRLPYVVSGESCLCQVDVIRLEV